MITLALLAGVYTALSGPAFDDWRANRKSRKDFPQAKIAFCLPSAISSR